MLRQLLNIVLITGALSSGHAAEENLLPNPGFEKCRSTSLKGLDDTAKMPKSWYFIMGKKRYYVSAPGTAGRVENSSVSRSGTSSILFKTTGVLACGNVKVKPESQYQVGVYAKSILGQGKVEIRTLLFDDGIKWFKTLSSTHDLSKAWQPCQQLFKLPKKTRVVAIFFKVSGASEKNGIILDDAKLKELGTEAENTLAGENKSTLEFKNSGFEAGGKNAYDHIKDWTVIFNNQEIKNVITQGGKKYGIYRFTVPGKSAEGNACTVFERSGSISQELTGHFKVNEPLEISLMAMTSGGSGAKIKFNIEQYQVTVVNGKPVYKWVRSVPEIDSPWISLNNQWNSYSFRYQPRRLESEIGKILFKIFVLSNDKDSVTRIDNVKIKKIHISKGTSTKRKGMTIAVPKVKQLPLIDGKFRNGEWKNAAMVGGFEKAVTSFGPMLSRDIEAYFAHDGDNIYVALRSRILEGEKLSYNKIMTKRDDPWGDDLFQVFMVKPGGGESLIFNISPVTFADAVCNKQSAEYSYQTGGDVASSVNDEWFTVEMKIPAKEAGIKKLTGSSMYFDAIRWFKDDDLYAALYPVRDLIKENAQWLNMAKLNFREDDRAIQLALKRTGAKLQLVAKPVGCADAVLTYHILEKSKYAYIDDCAGIVLDRTINRDFQLPPVKNNCYYLQLSVASGKDSLLTLDRDIVSSLPLIVDYRFDCLKKEMYVYVDAAGLSVPKQHCLLEIAMKGEQEVIFSQAFEVGLNQKKVITIPFKKLRNGWAILRVSAISPQGITSFEDAREIRFFLNKKKYFSDNKYGLNQTIPKPWTPIKYNQGVAEVIGRKIVFGKSLFPESINAFGKKILAAPVRLFIKTSKEQKDAICNPILTDKVDLKTNQLQIFGEIETPDYSIKGKTTLAYDGMMLFDLKVIPHNDKINRLYLDIPINDKIARALENLHLPGKPYGRSWRWLFFMDENKPEGKPLFGNTGQGCIPFENNMFHPIFEIRNETHGLCWFAESEKDWYLRGQAIQHKNGVEWIMKNGRYYDLVKTAESLILRVYLVSKTAPVKTLHYQFGLLPFPLKPERTDKRKWVYGAITTGFQGRPEDTFAYAQNGVNLFKVAAPMTNTPYYKKTLSYSMRPFALLPISPDDARNHLTSKKMTDFWCNTKQKRWLLTYNNLTSCSEDEPAGRFFQTKWKLMGIRRNDWPTMNSWSCNLADKDYEDFFFHHFYHWIKNNKINSIHFDNVSAYPVMADKRLGYGFEKEGRHYPTYGILTLRRYCERITKIMQQFDDDPYLELHGFGAPWIAMGTSHMKGEGWRHFPRFTFDKNNSLYNRQFKHDLRAFRYLMVGGYGAPVVNLPQIGWRKSKTPGSIHYCGLLLLHDIEYTTSYLYGGVIPFFRKIGRDFKLYTDFSIKFHPYTKPIPGMTGTDGKAIKVSVYAKKHSLMVVASNVTDKDASCRVTVNLKQWNLGDNPSCTVYEPVGEVVKKIPVVVKNGTMELPVDIKGTFYKVWIIKK